MKFSEPLIEGRFLRRYKRFFADAELAGETVVAHVPNTGSLKSCLFEGAPCMVSQSRDPKRKLKFTLQMLKTPGAWVGVNTSLPNDLVWEAWLEKRNPHWRKWDCGQREVKINLESRIDMAFWQGAQAGEKFQAEWLKTRQLHFVEVKNVTFCEKSCALFPDAVTTRGQKHLRELMALVAMGHSAELLFTIQRDDHQSFRPADHIDPEYGRLLRQAQDCGVRITPLSCDLTADAIVLNTARIIPLLL